MSTKDWPPDDEKPSVGCARECFYDTKAIVERFKSRHSLSGPLKQYPQRRLRQCLILQQAGLDVRRKLFVAGRRRRRRPANHNQTQEPRSLSTTVRSKMDWPPDEFKSSVGWLSGSSAIPATVEIKAFVTFEALSDESDAAWGGLANSTRRATTAFADVERRPANHAHQRRHLARLRTPMRPTIDSPGDERQADGCEFGDVARLEVQRGIQRNPQATAEGSGPSKPRQMCDECHLRTRRVWAGIRGARGR
ncbi:hypothetical protein D9611_009972 [Ephemerocybe angulata]|uniref:Uncharacterized protein n=1 Tax=Ephemerocybe angulata TaxID=980116 RepID=A0A8H5FFG5_9AGAR|nr:hypothetical protein D9611_009972 [Tulosesus angulatus]